MAALLLWDPVMFSEHMWKAHTHPQNKSGINDHMQDTEVDQL